MTNQIRITLFLMGELVAALRANDSDLFKRWLYGGIEDLGEPAVTELLLNCNISLRSSADRRSQHSVISEYAPGYPLEREAAGTGIARPLTASRVN